MVSKWFVASVEALILAATAMLIPVEIATTIHSVWKWLCLLWEHPAGALGSLWIEFWNSWVAVGTMAGLLYAAAVVPDLFGFGTAKVCFVLGNVLFLMRLSIEEKLHGQKGKRKPAIQRAVITMILLGFFGFITFLEVGSVANKEKGHLATRRNIWNASKWWQKTYTRASDLERSASDSPTEHKEPSQPVIPVAKPIAKPAPRKSVPPPVPSSPPPIMEACSRQVEDSPDPYRNVCEDTLAGWLTEVGKKAKKIVTEEVSRLIANTNSKESGDDKASNADFIRWQATWDFDSQCFVQLKALHAGALAHYPWLRDERGEDAIADLTRDRRRSPGYIHAGAIDGSGDYMMKMGGQLMEDFRNKANTNTKPP